MPSERLMLLNCQIVELTHCLLFMPQKILYLILVSYAALWGRRTCHMCGSEYLHPNNALFINEKILEEISSIMEDPITGFLD